MDESLPSPEEYQIHHNRDGGDKQIASLYAEFAEEDRQLAEEGLEDYARLLEEEDQNTVPPEGAPAC